MTKLGCAGKVREEGVASGDEEDQEGEGGMEAARERIQSYLRVRVELLGAAGLTGRPCIENGLGEEVDSVPDR